MQTGRVQNPEEGVGYLAAGVTSDCEMPDRNAGNHSSSPLEEQQKLLTTEPSPVLPSFLLSIPRVFGHLPV